MHYTCTLPPPTFWMLPTSLVHNPYNCSAILSISWFQVTLGKFCDITSFFLSCFLATRILTRPAPIKPGMSKGMFVGYSKGGLPLYSFSGPDGALPRSPVSVVRHYLRQILEASDSRNIFFYLCLNLVSSIKLCYISWQYLPLCKKNNRQYVNWRINQAFFINFIDYLDVSAFL